MSVNVLAWNIEDGFSKQEETARSIIANVVELNPDVAVFPEAYKEEGPNWLENAQADFDAAGFDVTHGLYEDDDNRLDRHGLLVITRKELTSDEQHAQRVSLASRFAIRAWLHDPETDAPVEFTGVHLDDRRESRRLEQVGMLPYAITPHIIAGDMNGTHRHAPKDKKLYAADAINVLTKIGLPIKEPGTPSSGSKLLDKAGRIGSLGSRLHDMTRGDVMQAFYDKGYTDADWQQMRPTMPSREPFVQLDHIMHSPHARTLEFSVLPHDPASDHRAILGKIAVGY